MSSGENEEFFDLEEWERKRKLDPRYLQYEGSKAIPFSFQLGFLTLSLESEVWENINRQWSENSVGHDLNNRVAGICFGEIKNEHISIKQCFEFEYTKDKNIIIDGSSYKTNLEFLGIYSNGTIPDDVDVSILGNLSKTLKRSLFLIKFYWCQKWNGLSTTIFENVFDIAKYHWLERLICIPVYKYPPHEGLINDQSNASNTESSKKMFYLTFYHNHIMGCRYDLDITDAQKSKLNERKEIYKIKPSLEEYRHTVFQLVKERGWTFENDFLTFDAQKDYIKMLQEFCDELKMEYRFSFRIPLSGNGDVFSCVEILTCGPSGHASSIKESQCQAAFSFLRSMSDPDRLNSVMLRIEAMKKKKEAENNSDASN